VKGSDFCTQNTIIERTSMLSATATTSTAPSQLKAKSISPAEDCSSAHSSPERTPHAKTSLIKQAQQAYCTCIANSSV
jgi:hypothetical protein